MGLVGRAKSRAQRLGIEGRCEFRCCDLADTDLSKVGVVFMYLPKPGLNFVVQKVLPRRNLPQGAVIFCATDPLPRDDKHYMHVQHHTQRVSLYSYRWQGAATESEPR